MKFPILTILFFLAGVTYAQNSEDEIFLGSLRSDTSTFKPNFIDKLKSSVRQSENDIEIRFYEISRKDIRSFSIVYCKKWSASYEKTSIGLKEMEIDQEKPIDSLFSLLVKNHIFSLPEQRKIETAQYYYSNSSGEIFGQDLGTVGDGTHYIVEFKAGDCFRRYSFHNPESFTASRPDIPEFQYYFNIAKIFSSLAEFAESK